MTFRKLAAASAGRLLRAYFQENTPEPRPDEQPVEGAYLDSGGRLTSYYTGRDSRGTWRPDMPVAVAEALGIDPLRPPQDADLERLFEAKRADTGEVWSRHKRTISAYDLTIAPHKSVTLAAEFASSPRRSRDDLERHRPRQRRNDALRRTRDGLGAQGSWRGGGGRAGGGRLDIDAAQHRPTHAASHGRPDRHHLSRGRSPTRRPARAHPQHPVQSRGHGGRSYRLARHQALERSGSRIRRVFPSAFGRRSAARRHRRRLRQPRGSRGHQGHPAKGGRQLQQEPSPDARLCQRLRQTPGPRMGLALVREKVWYPRRLRTGRP